MVIGILVFRPDSLTYTVARALTHAGHELFVWMTDTEFGTRPLSNVQRRLVETRQVTLVPHDEQKSPRKLDRLIVQVFPRPVECLRDFMRLAPHARRITLITAGDRSRTWRQAMKLQWLEMRRTARCIARIDSVVYKDGFYPCDLHGLLKARRVVGFDIHSQFLHSVDAFRAIHERDWRPADRRPILASFLGSRDPDSRTRILDDVRNLFAATQGDAVASNGKALYWHEYSDAAQAPLDPYAFLDVLTRSDFSLCPPGYSLVTHRPLEALLRGSIPVLPADHCDLYDLGLEDGVNCIGVPGKQWRETIERLMRFDEQRIILMRNNVHSMLARRVDYDACSERMRTRLGVPAAANRSA